MFIPKRIRVGYKNQQDTYTGKLAFVIYYDKANKIRKEASWNGWRDKKIEPNDYDNVPTEGFVLNKKAGDYQSSWGGRKAYSRIYDPRGFEFEINIDNLLYILEHCRSDPGKALEGKFVYAWDGTELVLLPEGTPEFKDSQDFSDLKEKRINIKKLEVGKEYYSKQKKEWCLYMGEFFINIQNSWWRIYFVNENRHVFKSSSGFYSNNKPAFVAQRDFSGNFEDVMTDLIENSILTDSVDSLVLKDNEGYANYAEYDGKIIQKISRWVSYDRYRTEHVYSRANPQYLYIIQSANLYNNRLEWIDEPNISVETFNSLPKLSLFIKTKKGMEYQYG